MSQAAQKISEAALRQIDIQEKIRQQRQRGRALDVPAQFANAQWATSLTGCLIHLCEYGEDEDVNQLQRHYWNVYQTYLETMKNESKALGSPNSFSGESGISYETDSESYIDWCKRARRKADLMRVHINQLQASVRSRANVYFIVNEILNKEDNQGHWRSLKHNFPQLRLVLDSLYTYFSKSDD